MLCVPLHPPVWIAWCLVFLFRFPSPVAGGHLSMDNREKGMLPQSRHYLASKTRPEIMKLSAKCKVRKTCTEFVMAFACVCVRVCFFLSYVSTAYLSLACERPLVLFISAQKGVVAAHCWGVETFPASNRHSMTLPAFASKAKGDKQSGQKKRRHQRQPHRHTVFSSGGRVGKHYATEKRNPGTKERKGTKPTGYFGSIVSGMIWSLFSWLNWLL